MNTPEFNAMFEQTVEMCRMPRNTGPRMARPSANAVSA